MIHLTITQEFPPLENYVQPFSILIFEGAIKEKQCEKFLKNVRKYYKGNLSVVIDSERYAN